MTPDQLADYCINNVGVPYKTKPPFSLIEGFNCFDWARHLYELAEIDVPKIDNTFKSVTSFVHAFKKTDNIKYLDIPLFYVDLLGKRHIGVMLNNTIMSHCCYNTNGVSISDITRRPWSHTLKGIYRLK